MAKLRNSVLLLLRLTLLLALSRSISFGSQWSEMNNGLADANIRVVDLDPINPAVVYAGTPNGLYRSTNGGMEWSNIGLKRVESLAIDFINPNTLYAGTQSGTGGSGPALFKSTDGGITWSNRTSPKDFDFSLLVMDPTTPNTLYIGSAWRLVGAGDVFMMKTRDGGETWVETFGQRGIGVGCCTLAIDTSNAQIVYAPGYLYVGGSLSDSGVLKSTDGGFTWTPTALMNPITVGDRGTTGSSSASSPWIPKIPTSSMRPPLVTVRASPVYSSLLTAQTPGIPSTPDS